MTNWLDFTKTIIALALMASESIAHEAEGIIVKYPIYKITKIVRAFRLIKKPMVYCAGKLTENLKLFYISNRPHFLWVYRR